MLYDEYTMYGLVPPLRALDVSMIDQIDDLTQEMPARGSRKDSFIPGRGESR